MKTIEIQFRSRRERENEVHLENNYRQLGNPGLLAAAQYCGKGRQPAVQTMARPLHLVAGE
ncbi:hypothetical protein [Fulvimarina sp. MAC3]|uniref:hypothetical protein n=1 Tax=Fulvimarina sp. MAC3 TaxID=3148887 RepID=UPI0031FD6E3A